ncbi:hypothetical protein ACQKMN_02860 [Ureibacillus composti]
MNHGEVYDLCCSFKGKRVCITDRNGRKHVGHITRIERDIVWIMPDRDCGGYGVGYFRRDRFGVGIAIGFIAGVVLAPLFFF